MNGQPSNQVQDAHHVQLQWYQETSQAIKGWTCAIHLLQDDTQPNFGCSLTESVQTNNLYTGLTANTQL